MPKNNAIVPIAAALLLIGFGCADPPRQTSPPPERPVACTDDAKICPDGSAVGRVGPNCEFAPCPSAPGTPPAPTSAPTSCRDACGDGQCGEGMVCEGAG